MRPAGFGHGMRLLRSGDLHVIGEYRKSVNPGIRSDGREGLRWNAWNLPSRTVDVAVTPCPTRSNPPDDVDDPDVGAGDPPTELIVFTVLFVAVTVPGCMAARCVGIV
jgi:hypothetical protein